MAVNLTLAKNGRPVFQKCMKSIGQSNTNVPRMVGGRKKRCWISDGAEPSGTAPTGMKEGDFILQLKSSYSPQISWDAVTGAASYNVYRSLDGLADYTLLGNTTDTSYDDETAVYPNHYDYVVYAVSSDGYTSCISAIANVFYKGDLVYIYEGGTTYTRIV